MWREKSINPKKVVYQTGRYGEKYWYSIQNPLKLPENPCLSLDKSTKKYYSYYRNLGTRTLEDETFPSSTSSGGKEPDYMSEALGIRRKRDAAAFASVDW